MNGRARAARAIPSRVRWIGMMEMCSRYGDVSVHTIRRWVSKGILPEPVPIGGKLLMWNEADLDAADAQARANAPAQRAAAAEASMQRCRLATEARRRQSGKKP